MKILLAEDDDRLRGFVCQLLARRGAEVDALSSGEEIEYYALHNDYDALVLDWMLPGQAGVAAAKSLRDKGYQGGILILTARAALQDKLDGFDCGADDYLVKPFEFDELYARVCALARRAQKTFSHEVFQTGSCLFDCAEKTVAYKGQTIRLTAREFQIAEILARNAGQVIARETLLDRVWGGEKDVSNNSVDAYMKLLRRKLGQAQGKAFIHNIRSVGYRWAEVDV